ncbi:MAG TPA: YbjQ family protein [Pyrinomonadaceae bacterium]
MENRNTNRLAPYEISTPRYSVSHHMVTTTFEIPGFRVTRNLGIVRGIVVRSRNVFVNIGAAFQSLAGGNITAWTKLCEQTRADAFEIMIQHATELGANAVVGARYDTTELAKGITEVLAYGTAVIVEPVDTGETYRS